MRAAFVFVAACAAVLAAALLRQQAAVTDNTQIEDASDASSDPTVDQIAGQVDQLNPFAQMDQNTVSTDSADANVQAFLAMIRVSEGTARADNPYAVVYGYGATISDFSDHPAITGEWRGAPLDSLGPSYAGKISTAAGAYQIIKPTWLGCKRAMALPDFSPASQDLAATYLIRERGALDDVRAGNFDAAVAKCANTNPPGMASNAVWASLPGANAPGQAMQRLDTLRTAYADAGGAFA
jgi:lysozyme